VDWDNGLVPLNQRTIIAMQQIIIPTVGNPADGEFHALYCLVNGECTHYKSHDEFHDPHDTYPLFYDEVLSLLTVT
jgi:hypothetical protein